MRRVAFTLAQDCVCQLTKAFHELTEFVFGRLEANVADKKRATIVTALLCSLLLLLGCFLCFLLGSDLFQLFFFFLFSFLDLFTFFLFLLSLLLLRPEHLWQRRLLLRQVRMLHDRVDTVIVARLWEAEGNCDLSTLPLLAVHRLQHFFTFILRIELNEGKASVHPILSFGNVHIDDLAILPELLAEMNLLHVVLDVADDQTTGPLRALDLLSRLSLILRCRVFCH